MEVPFSISARTAKLIGMENFANAEGAIVELVKNAYDADADVCVVVADIRDSQKDSRLFIIDNGVGMTQETILRHWMTIGTDDKLVNTKTSGKRRVKSGAKGIGRFALNRLGTKAEMVTFTGESDSQGYRWSVDWSKFDKASILSDITATVSECSHDEAESIFEAYGLTKLPVAEELCFNEFHGTVLCISDLRDKWTEDDLNSLLGNLEMLVPEHLKSLFTMYLYNLRDLNWSGEVFPAEYSDYDYKIDAAFDGKRLINVIIERNELNVSLLETKYASVFSRKTMQVNPYRIEDFRSKTIKKSIEVNDTVSSDLLSSVGPFTFTFFFIKNAISDDRERDGAKKYPYNQIDSAARKSWLDKFGGVRIFRDEFRVRPYGENGNDWLDLGRRQAQSPGGAGQKIGGYRIRPNQISGVVNISRLTNTAFEDKSSREGIQENDEFQLFRNLLIQIIAVFEEDRNYIMFNLSDQFRKEHPNTMKAKDIAKEAMSLSREGQSEETLKLRTLAESYHSLEEELDAKEAELSMIRGLASMGISVATYTHELRSVMLRLLPRNSLLRTILTRYLPVEQFDGMRFNNPYKELDTMKGEDEKLYNWLLYSLHSIQRSKRDWKEINLAAYFEDFVRAWEPSLSKKNIKMIPNISGMEGACLDAYEMDLDSVYNNFVSNSINAFLRSPELNKIINLNVVSDHGYAVIDFLDNGSGLASEYKNNPDVIFNAFETSIVDNKNNKIGTGMGLFIAKGVVDKFNDSTIAVLPVEKGFGIRTIFKIEKEMIKVVYIDEEVGWQSTAHAALSDKYDIYIPEVLPQNVTDIWGEVCNSQVAVIDYRLNESGQVAYTGDDVVREIHKHNRHFPVIIITSYEDNAIQECTEVQTIRGKEMFNSAEELKKLCHMIDSAAAIYEKKKAKSEDVICALQEKIAAGEKLSDKEEADRYDAELYLSELDLDSSARGILINTRTLKDIDEMLSLARTIVEKHKK